MTDEFDTRRNLQSLPLLLWGSSLRSHLCPNCGYKPAGRPQYPGLDGDAGPGRDAGPGGQSAPYPGGCDRQDCVRLNPLTE